MSELSRTGDTMLNIFLHAKLKPQTRLVGQQPHAGSTYRSVYDGAADEHPASSDSQSKGSEGYFTAPEEESEEGYVVLRKDGQKKHEVSVLEEDYEIVDKDESRLASSPMRDDFDFPSSLGEQYGKAVSESSPKASAAKQIKKQQGSKAESHGKKQSSRAAGSGKRQEDRKEPASLKSNLSKWMSQK